MRAGIFSGDALLDDEGRLKTVAALIDEVKATPQMKGLSLYDEVSTKETYTVEPCGEYEGKEPLYTVAAVDLGVKGMTPHRMAERGCRVHVVPSTITFEELTALNPDGVFFSNGPATRSRPTPKSSCCAGPGRRLSVLRHLLRQSAARPCTRLRHLQAQVRPSRHQPARQGYDHRQGGGHRAQSRLRG